MVHLHRRQDREAEPQDHGRQHELGATGVLEVPAVDGADQARAAGQHQQSGAIGEPNRAQSLIRPWRAREEPRASTVRRAGARRAASTAPDRWQPAPPPRSRGWPRGRADAASCAPAAAARIKLPPSWRPAAWLRRAPPHREAEGAARQASACRAKRSSRRTGASARRSHRTSAVRAAPLTTGA